MSLGSQVARRKVYFLSLRSKKNEQLNPHFKVQKREGSITVDLPDEVEVSGNLLAIRHGEYEYKGDKVKTITLILVDGPDQYKIELNLNVNTTRDIINRILGTQDYGFITIRTFAKEEFANVYMENNGTRMEWAYKYDDLKQMISEVPDPKSEGKFIKVYHKLNTFLLDKWIGQETVVAANARAKGFDKLDENPKMGTEAAASQTASTAQPSSTAAPAPSLQNEFDATGHHDEDFIPPGPSDQSGSDDLPF
jgi:hypothetical protein